MSDETSEGTATPRPAVVPHTGNAQRTTRKAANRRRKLNAKHRQHRH